MLQLAGRPARREPRRAGSPRPPQAAVYGSHEAALTPGLFERVLQQKVHEHQQRRAFVEGTAPHHA